jgi:hypothetical protein
MSSIKFHSKWEAEVETDEVLTSGTWYYQNEIPYSAQLIKQKWNYKSTDLPILDEILEVPFCDYIDYSINDEGIIYFWRFESSNNKTSSPVFPTYFLARDHINTYGYKYELNGS